MHLTLRQLEIFEAVAHHLNYTRAAEALHLTQPAVSMQVRQLEDSVGLPLFEQLGRRIHLTTAGREVLGYARAIAQQLDEMEQVLDRLKGLSGGRLRIAVATTANYVIPALLGRFSRRWPEVTVSLDVTNRQELLRQLAENSIDLAIMGQPPPEADVDAAVFMDNPLVVVAPPQHALARRRAIPLARLQQETFLVREPGSGTRIAMERFFAGRGVVLRTGMELGSNEAIKQAVQAGVGPGALSRAAVRQGMALARPGEVRGPGGPVKRPPGVVHRRGKRLSAAAEAFRGFLLADAADGAEAGAGIATPDHSTQASPRPRKRAATPKRHR